MTPDRCPKCDANFTGAPIPEDARHHYGDKTHFSRVVGVYDFNLDRTVAWLCPDCGHQWPR